MTSPRSPKSGSFVHCVWPVFLVVVSSHTCYLLEWLDISSGTLNCWWSFKSLSGEVRNALGKYALFWWIQIIVQILYVEDGQARLRKMLGVVYRVKLLLFIKRLAYDFWFYILLDVFNDFPFLFVGASQSFEFFISFFQKQYFYWWQKGILCTHKTLVKNNTKNRFIIYMKGDL